MLEVITDYKTSMSCAKKIMDILWTMCNSGKKEEKQEEANQNWQSFTKDTFTFIR